MNAAMARLVPMLACWVAIAGAQIAPPRTFGNGIITLLSNSSFKPATLLNHTLDGASAYGVVTHFWTTGEIVNDEIVLDYFVDGEPLPSISMQAAMASGQGYARKVGNLGGDDRDPPYGLFSAGEKMGKSGQVGGWYHYHKVLFRKSILITARTLTTKQVAYMVVRGHEVDSSSSSREGLRMPSGYVVPARAKLQLMRIDNVTYDPLAFVPLVSLPAGYAGLLYLTSLATTTSPAGNDYVEGCWHLFAEASQKFPGIILGTGLEDFFDSAYWFCSLNGQAPCLFAHPTSGVLHFTRLWGNGTVMSSAAQKVQRPYPKGTREELSAYRFFDTEVVGFRNGGSLQWRVGDTGGKCFDNTPQKSTANPVAVHSYAWVYTWPLDPNAPPVPNSPPLQCMQSSACGPKFPNPHALDTPELNPAALSQLREKLQSGQPRLPSVGPVVV